MLCPASSPSICWKTSISFIEVNVVILPWVQATLGHMFNATEEAISSPLPSPQPSSPRLFSPLAQGRLLQPHSLYQQSSAGFHAPHLRCLPALGISGLRVVLCHNTDSMIAQTLQGACSVCMTAAAAGIYMSFLFTHKPPNR